MFHYTFSKTFVIAVSLVKTLPVLSHAKGGFDALQEIGSIAGMLTHHTALLDY